MTPPAPDPFPVLPHRFGRYELRARLGGGGMGVVYRAHNTAVEDDLALMALKVPSLGRNCSDEERELFEREYRLMFALRGAAQPAHRVRVCRVFDSNEVDECPYFTMEHLTGQPLHMYWRAERERLGPAAAGELVQRLARLLDAVHRTEVDDRVVIHLDLKPENVFACPKAGESEPELVVLDFGIAVAIDPKAPPRGRTTFGTFGYMPPEQLVPGWRGRAVSPRTDVYALGAVLYHLMFDRPPSAATEYRDAVLLALNADPLPPEPPDPRYAPLYPICRRALARDPEARFESMAEFADALAVVSFDAQLAAMAGASPGATMNAPSRPRVSPASLRYAFVPYGFTAPAALAGCDQLFLDVGNRLAPGVIDHHQARGVGPTAKLVRERGDLIDAAVSPTRRADAPFTVVLHDYPDLDAVTSVLFARDYLATCTVPDRAEGLVREALVRYVERADAGATRLNPDRPYSLHVAFTRLVARSLRLGSQFERNQAIVREGLGLLDFVLEHARTGAAVDELDAFAAPVFTDEDRREVLADGERYRAKLADPQTRARRCRLRLPGQDGVEKAVEALIVRNVQNAGDPHRVAHFKDWARGDRTASRDCAGFAALSVFMPKEDGHPRRCILSVTPESGASLKGLGQLLDEAEGQVLTAAFGVDTRKTDPATGRPLPVRPGYDNADPWYDGRGHGFTIIDAPRAGTWLSADRIEEIFFQFGHATEIASVGS